MGNMGKMGVRCGDNVCETCLLLTERGLVEAVGLEDPCGGGGKKGVVVRQHLGRVVRGASEGESFEIFHDCRDERVHRPFE